MGVRHRAKFTTDAASDTFHIISVSLHSHYHKLYFSSNSFPPSVLQPEGKELLFERQGDTDAPVSFLFKHIQTQHRETKPAAQRCQELKDCIFCSLPTCCRQFCITSTEQQTEHKANKNLSAAPKAALY